MKPTSFRFIGPLTQEQSWARHFALLHRRPSKSSRAHKRRHRAFLRWRAMTDGLHSATLYRSARTVLPLP